MKDIIGKFKFRGNAIVLNAPPELAGAFKELGFKIAFNPKASSENTLVFIYNSVDYRAFLTKQLSKIEPDSVLWFAYPKGTSKVKTDINRDSIRITGEEFGITTVTAISINDTWSALRFRPINKIGVTTKSKAAIR